SKKAFDLFAELNVMNHTEVESRYEIELEDYIKKVQIEGRVLGDIVRNHIIPTAFKYQNLLIENIKGLKDIFGDSYEELAAEQILILKKTSMHVNELNAKLHAMMDARKEANSLDSVEKMAHAYCDNVKPYFDEIRYHADKLELMVDNELWTLTKYRELLFTR
ncbi:MAG: glutamine synthetase type III, partial [Myroides sp.]